MKKKILVLQPLFFQFRFPRHILFLCLCVYISLSVYLSPTISTLQSVGGLYLNLSALSSFFSFFADGIGEKRSVLERNRRASVIESHLSRRAGGQPPSSSSRDGEDSPSSTASPSTARSGPPRRASLTDVGEAEDGAINSTSGDALRSPIGKLDAAVAAKLERRLQARPDREHLESQNVIKKGMEFFPPPSSPSSQFEGREMNHNTVFLSFFCSVFDFWRRFSIVF